MAETISTKDHLDSLPPIHRDMLDSHFGKLHRLYPEGLRPLWEADQPNAEKILNRIAKTVRETQESQKYADTEAVWKEALRRSFARTNYLRYEVEYAKDLPDAEQELDGHMDMILAMTALDQANGSSYGLELMDMMAQGGFKPYILEAAKRSDSSGMTVLSPDGYVSLTEAANVAEITKIKEMGSFTEKLNAARDAAGRQNIERAARGEKPTVTDDTMDRMTLPFSDEISFQLTETLTEGNWTKEQFSELLGARRSFQDMKANGTNYPPDYMGIIKVIDKVAPEKIREIYMSPSDKESGTMKYVLRKATEAGYTGGCYQVVGLLSKIYGTSPENLVLDSSFQKDKVIETITSNPNILLDALIPLHHKERNLSNEQYSMKVRDGARTYLTALGVPGGLMNEFLKAVNEKTMEKDESGRTKQGDDRCVNGSTLRQILARAGIRIEEVGSGNLEKLSEKWGIINFNNYSAEQLQRMLDLADGNPKLIEDLQAGDVTVVFTDAKGDHNGAMTSNGTNFEKPSGRTLFFEINQPSDFYRYMLALEDLGVRPSSAVLATHGSPGGMFFGGEERFVLSNNSAETTEELNMKEHDDLNRLSLEGSRSLSKVVGRFMQPSRGIDDPEERKGQTYVILESCSQAKRRPVTRTIEGKEVITEESTAETLAKKLGSTATRVVAAPEVISTIIDKPTGKLRFVGSGPVDAKVVSVGPNGEIITDSVEGVQLTRNGV